MPGAASSGLVATFDFPLIGRVHVRQTAGDTVHWSGGHGVSRAIIQTPRPVVLTRVYLDSEGVAPPMESRAE